MKLVLLLGLLCAAWAANSGSIIPLLRGFKPGHHYSYEFDGQVASSLSNGQDYSVIRVRSKVEMDFLNDKSVLVKLTQPELGQLNAYFKEPERIHRFEKFDPIEVKSEHVSKLDLPFEMRYDNGKISEIKFHNEDSIWSENIKRSIINLLQIQSETSRDEDKPYYSSSYYYTTNETTIEGDCEVAYYIQKLDDRDYETVEETKPSVNITKTINFEKCRRRPETRYNFYRQSEPLEWNSNDKKSKDMDEKKALKPIVDSISQYEFSLENDRIQSAQVISRYSYDLVDKDHVSLTTYTVGQIVLKTNEKRSPPEADFTKKPTQSLMHSDEFDLFRERFITEGDENYLRLNPYLRIEYPSEVVKNIMRRLVRSSIEKAGPEGVEEDATRQFAHLVAILRLCTKDDIQKVHDEIFKGQEYDKEETKQFVKEILADALAIAGTKNTIDHLVEKIQNEEITPSKASRTLEKLHKLRLTSYTMAQPVWKLCESKIAKENENLKRSCYLAWGAMINAMCGHNHEHEQDHEKWVIASTNKKICDREVKQRVVKQAMELYTRSSSKNEKVLALKTLGNMGVDESVQQLEKIIRDKTEDRIVRVHAIDALRNLRDQIPEKVQRVLTPIFRDRREHPEIRINAFHQLIRTRPDSALLHLIVAEMTHETNVDVKSFVVTTIRRLAENADNVLDEESKKAIKSSLVLLEQIDESVIRQSASNLHQAGYFSEPSSWHEMGGLLGFASIFSNDSYLPKEVTASLDLLMEGHIQLNAFQYGLHMQELEQLVTRMAQSIESKNFDDVVVRGRRGVLSEYNPVEYLKNLYGKMRIVARRRSPSDAEPLLMFYRRHNNMDYSFFLLDEATIPEVLKKLVTEGRLDVSSLEKTDLELRTNGAVYNFESQTKIPTTMGVPIVISSRMITLGFVDGTFSLNFGPSNSEKISGVKVDLKVHPQIATSVIMKMEVFSPLFTSGVKTIHSAQARVPLDLDAELKQPNWVPTINFRLPKEETRLVHVQSRPITFVRVWPQQSKVFVEPKEKTLVVPEIERLVTVSDVDTVAPFIDMPVKIEGHWYRRPFTGYDWILSGDNALVVKVSPSQSSTKTLRLSGDYVSRRDSVSSKLQLERIFSEQSKLFNDAEGQEVDLLKRYVSQANSKLTNFQNLLLKVESMDGAKNSIDVDLKLASDERAHTIVMDKKIKVDMDEDWTWETFVRFVRPELNGVYTGVRSEHFVGKVLSNWGSVTTNTVSLNIYGKPSEKRIRDFKMLLNKKSESEDEYDRESTWDEKFEDLPSILKPNDFKMSVEYQVSDRTTEYVQPLYNWLKTCPKASVYIPDRYQIDNMLTRRHSSLFARVTVDHAYNLTLTTGEEQLEITHFESDPQEMKLSRKPKTIVDLFAKSHDDYAQCTYKREEITTFDGQTVDIPMTTCYTVLAKDCGDENTPKFALMAKKMSKSGDDLKVKFVTQKKTFELMRVNNDMVIKADGQRLTEEDFEEYRIRKIEATDMTIYEIKCPKSEAILRFDGKKIVVKISDIYMNRQCGVCGHMNNDRDDDFLMNDRTPAKSIKEFQLSYMNRDEDCEPESIREFEREEKPKSRRRQDVDFSLDETESDERQNERPERNPMMKTRVVEKREQLCFSSKPVQTCPEGFDTKDTDKAPKIEKVKFVCMKRTTTKAQRLLREARKDIVELQGETTNHVEEIEIPTRCVKY